MEPSEKEIGFLKEYRQSSHLGPLTVWALLCAATAIVLFLHSGKVVNRALRIEETAAAVVFLIFGPAAFSVYLLRCRLVWIAVDPKRGIVVGGRRRISWSEIRKVDRRRPRLRKRSGPSQVSDIDMKNIGDVPDPSGCLDILGGADSLGEGILLFIAGVILVLVAFAFVYLFFLVFIPLFAVPLLEVFAPFGERIRIHTANGTLVLRDLRDADDFIRQVRRHVEVLDV